MTEKRKAGQPKKPVDKARGAIFSVRLTPAERAAVEQEAEKSGKKASAWARDVLVAAIPRVVEVTVKVAGDGGGLPKARPGKVSIMGRD